MRSYGAFEPHLLKANDGQATKGAWWMPWCQKAMKDVVSCDKPRGAASRLRSGDFRMGKPSRMNSWNLTLNT